MGKLTVCRADTRQMTRFLLDPADFCSRPDMLDGTYVSSLSDKSGKPRGHGLRSLTPFHALFILRAWHVLMTRNRPSRAQRLRG